MRHGHPDRIRVVAWSLAGFTVLVTAFAARLGDAVDPDAVRADLLGVVRRSPEPTHVAVWVKPTR